MGRVSAVAGPLASSNPEPGEVGRLPGGSEPVLGGRGAVPDDDPGGQIGRGGGSAMRRQRVLEDGGGRTAADELRRRLLAGAPVTERRLELAGVSTAVLEGGEGPPVMLLHGQGGWAGLWLPVIAGLVGAHRVVAPDLPGLGASR